MSHGSQAPLFSDRLHAVKSSGSEIVSEVYTPLAGAGASLDFHDAPVGICDSGKNAMCGAATSSEIDVVRENGVSAAKKAKIGIQATFAAQNDLAASSLLPEKQKIVPTAADLMSLAIEIKRINPGCGVKKVFLEMLHKHPDWTITEHRIWKLLHENGLTNVKKPSTIIANTGSSSQQSLEQHHCTDGAVAEIHFDILSLPLSNAVSAEHWQDTPSPSSHNSGSPLQSANIIDLDKLFNPATSQQIPNAADASETGIGPSTPDLNCVDLGEIFPISAVSEINVHH
jgi:hypothetical protein